MAKTIVTHFSPDFDGIPAIWLLKRFHPDFADSQVKFVPVGDATLDGQPVDSNPDIVHVDCGMGRFDHHDRDEYTCGAKLVYEWLVAEGFVSKDEAALERMIEVITALDHGEDNQWPEADSDRYEFCLHQILVGWKLAFGGRDEEYVGWVMHALDGVYRLMKAKVAAEKELEIGVKFDTHWGKATGCESSNDGVLDLGIKKGLALVVRKDPKRGQVRITGTKTAGVDLTAIFARLKAKDPAATWYLHPSKVLLRNGSSRNPGMIPTKLSLKEVIEVLKNA